MTAIQRQLERADMYETFMFTNIRRVSVVIGRMKQNVKRCRLSSVLSWKEKADKILNKRFKDGN